MPYVDRDNIKSVKLTKREQEIVDLVIVGMENKEIAEKLGIGRSTVRTHLYNVYGKLNARNRVELTRKVLNI